VSFIALRDLMQVIGYSAATAWIFPAIIDTAVAVSTMMLVALGDKPVRRTRVVAAPERGYTPPRPHSVRADRIASSAEPAHAKPARRPFAEHSGADHAALGQALVDAGATTKPAPVVASILSAHADGKALNRIASDVGVHHKTVSKIIAAAQAHKQQRLVAV
jgi:hypothetical protein